MTEAYSPVTTTTIKIESVSTTLKSSPKLFLHSLSCLYPSLATADLFSVILLIPFPKCSINGIIQYANLLKNLAFSSLFFLYCWVVFHVWVYHSLLNLLLMNIWVFSSLRVFTNKAVIYIRIYRFRYGLMSAFLFGSVQFSSVTQSCLTLYNPMNRSTPGLRVHHQLPEFTQTHVLFCRYLVVRFVGLYVKCMFNFVSYIPNCFPKGCSILYYHQQHVRALVASHSQQDSMASFSLHSNRCIVISYEVLTYVSLMTTRRSNQSILKEISPEYPLKGMMLKLKLQYFGHVM